MHLIKKIDGRAVGQIHYRVRAHFCALPQAQVDGPHVLARRQIDQISVSSVVAGTPCRMAPLMPTI
jgi:hypothetical protein